MRPRQPVQSVVGERAVRFAIVQALVSLGRKGVVFLFVVRLCDQQLGLVAQCIVGELLYRLLERPHRLVVFPLAVVSPPDSIGHGTAERAVGVLGE